MFTNILKKAHCFIFLVPGMFKELFFAYKNGGKGFRIKNDVYCLVKVCDHLDKIAPKTVKLMKKAYKDKCFHDLRFQNIN